MTNNISTSVVIGILLGVMLFPMIMIPLMGIAVVIGAIYLIVHDVIMPTFQHHDSNHTQ